MWISLCLFVVLVGAKPSGAQNYSYAERPTEDFFFIDSSHGWIVVRDPGRYYLLRTTNGGTSWSKFSLPRGINKVFFLDPQIGWAIALESSGNESAKTYLFRTRNGGKSWERSPGKPFALCVASDCSLVNGLAFVDQLHGWMIGQRSGGDGIVWETSDGGHTVHKLVLPAVTGAASGIYTNRSGRIWIFGENFILSSADEGKSWREALVSTGLLKKRAELFLESAFILDDGLGWAVGGGSSGVILGTSDHGGSWHIELDSGHITIFMDLCFWDDAHGCAVGPSTSLFCTVDGGKTWSEKSVLPEKTGMQSVFFSKIVMLKSRRGWVLRTGGYLYKTINGGETWQEFDPLKGEELH
jgi:photosystem II stability/assembly factor-like uncharacterized protein